MRAEEFVQMYDELDYELWDDIQENLEYEFDEAAEAAAREEYLVNPIIRTEAYLSANDTTAVIEEMMTTGIKCSLTASR